VTIATNMAGRGTDIQLGGNFDMRVRQELRDVTDPVERERRIAAIRAEVDRDREIVKQAGGLYVIGTERHESRRIDNQLRGRSGRQGDPGASRFYLSLEDDLMRIFGSERMDGMLQRLGLKEGEAIVHSWINKAIAKAQQKVEARNFEIRKNLLKYDNVMNDQRRVIYDQRRDIMRADDVSATIVDMRQEVIGGLIAETIPPNAYAEQWNLPHLEAEVLRVFGLELPIVAWGKEEGIADEEVRERLTDAVDRRMAEKAANFGPEMMRMAEKSLLLQILDQCWKEHLLALDHLRQGIGLRAYGQRDPLNEYKREAFDLFEGMLGRLRETVTSVLAHIELRVTSPGDDLFGAPEPGPMREGRGDPAMADVSVGPEGAQAPQARRARAFASPGLQVGAGQGAPPGWVFNETTGRYVDPRDSETWGKVARNAPCPCGSGKKYKQCHGAL
jgi:preprotein translocase subunit SecA